MTKVHIGYSDTIEDFGQADRFQEAPLCGGPFGADTTYSDTMIVP